MRARFADLMFTDALRAEQAARGSAEQVARVYARFEGEGLGPDERDFIETRNHFYMATVNEDGWPYVQHRGGPAGFLKVLDETTLGFADYKGNRQYVSTGNLSADDRVSLFLIDYPRKARLKMLGHASVRNAEEAPDLAGQLAQEGQGRVERLFTIRIAAFDWNCPQFITPRFDEGEIAGMLGPRFNELTEEVERLKAQIRDLGGQA